MVNGKHYDVIVLGAGAAGLTAAASALKCGRRVLVLDMGATPGRKVLASGGGNCNFTNAAAGVNRYFGENRDFVRGALARVTANDILDWMREHNLTWHEKTPGQYFCDQGANAVLGALVHDADGAKIVTGTNITDVIRNDNNFTIKTNRETHTADHVIVATGGTSFGTLGVSDIGYRIAKKFGHKIIPVRPALCAIATSAFSSELAGISLPVEICVGREVINDALLFTHFGIGGPAVYRATVRDFTAGIKINLVPGVNVFQWLRDCKQTDGKKSPSSILATRIPARLAKYIAGNFDKNIADLRDTDIRIIADAVNNIVIPAGDIKLHNLASAEIVRGGVSVNDISSKTMESKLCPGLFFAGEVMDIAGDLGGFNLHWAWASGRIAGQNA